MFVYRHPLAVPLFTKPVEKAQTPEPSRERCRGKEALLKSFAHKIKGGEVRGGVWVGS